ncbi:MAG: transposase [Cytophagaceae bacterium]|nr:MAG: transposase [Cytophagaceae bacterium]
MEKRWASKRSAAAVDYSLPAQRVTRLLDNFLEHYGKPERLRSDNGPEFISQTLQDWCTDKQVVLHRIERQRPTVGEANSKCLH